MKFLHILKKQSRINFGVGLLAGLSIGFIIEMMRGIGSSCSLASDLSLPKSNRLDMLDHVTTDASNHQSRAVIHMGIHKTGSSSIQSFLQRNVESLLSDGYKILGSENYIRDNVNFAACFVEGKHGYSCDPQLLLLGLEIAYQNDNIFVSAEPLCSMSTQAMKKLAAYIYRIGMKLLLLFTIAASMIG
jgi:hypothetical protein